VSARAMGGEEGLVGWRFQKKLEVRVCGRKKKIQREAQKKKTKLGNKFMNPKKSPEEKNLN